MGLGAPQQPQPFAFALMPAQALPYIAHLYTNGMVFKRTLGDASSVGGASAAMVTKPGLKMTLNGGYHPITIELAGAQSAPNLVPDPGFEASDVLADVQNSYVLGAPGEWVLLTTTTDRYNGRRAMKCTTTNTAGWNSLVPKILPNLTVGGNPQLFAVIPGATYKMSCWSKQNAGVKASVATHLKVTYFDRFGVGISNFQAFAASGAQPWTFRTGNWVVPPEAFYAQVAFMAGAWDGVTGTDAQTWVDDLRFALGTDPDPIAAGDIIQLTEQGDNSGAILYSGIVEELPDEVGAGATGSKHQVTLTPFVAELGDTDFNQQYSTLTDVAQMVRDAVNKTGHCRVSQKSCGDTGVLAIYNFNQTNVLEVLNVAKRIAGVNFWWFVDAMGLVWFQSATPSNPARITLKRGSDYTRRRRTPSIVGLKNKLRALGGYPVGASVPIQSLYSNAASQKAYGVRNLDPGLVFPTVTDQGTLDKIVNTVGAALDRVHTSIDLDAPLLTQRLTLAVPGGLTVRLLEPSQETVAQPAALGSGGYSGPYVAQDIESNGVQQKLLTGDVPISGLKDIEFELNRIVQRLGVLSAGYGT
jgi:hypothetical protein